MSAALPVASCDFLVFGGTGDLAVRKLLPALYLRDRDGQLPADTTVLAVSRAGLDEQGYRDKIRGELPRFVSADEIDEITLDRFLARLSHHTLDLDEDQGWPELARRLATDDAERVRVFYMACAPALFGAVSRRLADHGLVTDHSRVVLEKPIGTDLASARAINDAVGAVFEEPQIFRIDHYLGKESVQNLLVTRFANTFLEPLWNAHAIDHVQITAAESLGVGTRGGYYDTSGALRDMVQNHLLQLLCLVAMEPPTYVDRETVRDEKLKVLQALRPMSHEDVGRLTVRRPVRPRPGRRRGGRVVPHRRRTARQPDRDLRGPQGRGAELALGRRAVLPAHRQADGVALLGDRDPVQAGAAPDVPERRGHQRAQPPGHPAPARRGHEAAHDGQGARPGGHPVPAGLPQPELRRRPSSAAPPTPTSACSWTSSGATRPCSCAATRSRPPGPGSSRCSRPGPRADHGPRPYPAGTTGPTAATTLIERDGRAWHESSRP